MAMQPCGRGEVELIRPNGLVERLPERRNHPDLAGYARAKPGRPDDRRQRPRPAGQPWRGRLVDRLV